MVAPIVSVRQSGIFIIFHAIVIDLRGGLPTIDDKLLPFGKRRVNTDVGCTICTFRKNKLIYRTLPDPSHDSPIRRKAPRPRLLTLLPRFSTVFRDVRMTCDAKTTVCDDDYDNEDGKHSAALPVGFRACCCTVTITDSSQIVIITRADENLATCTFVLKRVAF